MWWAMRDSNPRPPACKAVCLGVLSTVNSGIGNWYAVFAPTIHLVCQLFTVIEVKQLDVEDLSELALSLFRRNTRE